MAICYVSVIIYVLFVLNTVWGSCPKRCICLSTSVSCVWANYRTPPENLSQNLTILDLRYNKIEDVSEETYIDLFNLETLLLNNNNIKILRRGVFKQLSKLHTLNLHQNSIKNLEPGTFENLRNLKYLDISQNNLQSLEAQVFEGISELDKLYLHNNKIKNVSADAFPDVISIINLRLDGNPLQCDCELFWLVEYLLSSEQKNKNIQVNGFCKEPNSLGGKPLFDLKATNEIQKCRDPSVIVHPEIVGAVKDKSPVFIKCIIKGYPRPRITWLKNDLELDFRNINYKIYPTGLKIEAVSILDEGGYTCVATNAAGSAKSKPVLILIEKSKKTSTKQELLTGEVKPKYIVLGEGNSTQIDCKVKGKPNFPVKWFKNNLQIQDVSPKIRLWANGTLTLTEVQLDDSGRYDCVTTEPSTYIFGSVEVIINAQPKILSYPRSFSVGTGATIELKCLTVGYPTPVISWFKDSISLVPNERMTFRSDGNLLKIENGKEDDSGMYTCVAQNSIGTTEQSTEVQIKNKGPRIPRIIITPFDIDVPQLSSIEIPCKTDGEPLPRIQWLKNNVPLRVNANRLRTSNVQSLRIYNVTVKDSGIYTCIASNIYGNDSASGIVTVTSHISANEEQIMNAYHEAKMQIDRAINATINQLFAQHNESRSPDFLLKIGRYPDEFSRNIIKPADVYARTLVNVRKHISSGLKMNLTEGFVYSEVLSQSQLELVANLSGCVPHQLIANCSDVEFNSKYATFDGTCNNLQHPMWGSSYSAFRRLLKPIYENGINTPVGWNRDNRYNGFAKPDARLVSTTVIRTYNITDDEEVTHMLMQWGQYIDHDLDHALPSTTAESWEGLDCKKTCAYSEPCFPMEIPNHDSRITTRRCMDFIRSSAVCGSGDTSVFFNKIYPREQLNQLTSYIDSSQIYGFIRDRSFLLRDLTSGLGLLRTGISSEHGKSYLPISGTNEVDCRRDLSESNVGCFLAGDIRVNEQVGLIALQTILLREHNRLATALKKINPHWSGDTLYFEARKILNAQSQHITYAHWMPSFLGSSGVRKLGSYTGYNPDIDPSISNEFATAALRIGHTLINPELKRLDSILKPIPQGHLSLGKAFFSPWRLIQEGGVDPLMRGFFTVPAKLKKTDQNLNDQLTDQLFTAAHAVSLDLAAMNIQRGRDHGLPSYMDYRKFYNFSTSDTFDGFEHISNSEVLNKLKMLYGSPGNIDLWVGGVLEDVVTGSRVGPLFQSILIEQFKRLRDGDRFWYENHQVFTNSQLEQIKKTSLARIICDNGDNISRISRDVFILPSLQNPNFVPCDEIPGIDLQEWQNCGAGC